MTAVVSSKRRRRPVWPLSVVAILVLVTVGGAPAAVSETVKTVVSGVTASDGSRHTITNHVRVSPGSAEPAGRQHREWLLAWTGDAGPSTPDTTDPDFLAVIDATRGPTYGKVVNTVTIDGVGGNEPHHMQYMWHKGDKVYAGGMFTNTTYVFDVSRLPLVTLSGFKPASATPCGSVPDAFHVLRDGTAYGTYLGGPPVSGACTYTNGETRVGNGFAGTPGEVIRIAPDGEVLAEIPATPAEAEGPYCDSGPALPTPSCANPHGISVREDLNRMMTSDLSEIRHTLAGELPPGAVVARDTVRVFDIENRNDPELVSVSHLPKGPRPTTSWLQEEQRAVMETALTNKPWHRGGFASTMGGAVFYAPDVTVRKPKWTQILDDATAARTVYPASTDVSTSIGDGGAWLMVSPDDRYLFHIMAAQNVMVPGRPVSGVLYVLDIQKLLRSGGRVECSVDQIEEITAGGAERDCPEVVSAMPIDGGPHWGAFDTFQRDRTGTYHESANVHRVATANYFVAATGFDGDHRICMFNVDRDGRLEPDTSFADETDGRTCVGFNRTHWPHGEYGDARPHGLLFVVT